LANRIDLPSQNITNSPNPKKALYDVLQDKKIIKPTTGYDKFLEAIGEDTIDDFYEDRIKGKLKYEDGSPVTKEEVSAVLLAPDKAYVDELPDYKTFAANMKNPEVQKQFTEQLKSRGLDITPRELNEIYGDAGDVLTSRNFGKFNKLNGISYEISKIEETNPENNPKYQSDKSGWIPGDYQMPEVLIDRNNPEFQKEYAAYQEKLKPLKEKYDKAIVEARPAVNKLSEQVDKMYNESLSEDFKKPSVNPQKIEGYNSMNNPPVVQYSDKTKQLQTIKNFADKAQKLINAPTKSSLNAFWKGVGDTDVENVLFMGLKELGGSAAMLKIADKQKNNEPLTDLEKSALSAYYLYDSIRSGVKPANFYIGGAAAVESLSFMLQIVSTGGILKGTVKLGEKQLGKFATRQIIKKLGERGVVGEAAGQVAKRFIQKEGINKFARWGTELGASAVGSLAQAQVMPMMHTDRINRMLGEIEQTDNGDFVFKNADPSFKAWMKSTLTTGAEILSEVSGGMMNRAAKRLGLNIGMQVGKPAFRNVAKNLMYDGFLFETAEEYVAKLFHTAMGFDKEQWKDFFDADEFIQIVSSVGAMSVMFAGFGGANVAASKAQQRNNRKKAEKQFDEVFGARVEMLRENEKTANRQYLDKMFNNANGEQIYELINNKDMTILEKWKALQQFDGLTREQKEVTLNYMYETMKADMYEGAYEEIKRIELSPLINQQTGQITTGLIKSSQEPVTILRQQGDNLLVRYEDGQPELIPANQVEIVESQPVDNGVALI
jgi:hypothetical protein